MVKSMYTISDIAMYMKCSDFKHSEEIDILKKIWNDENEYLKEEYNDDRKKFFRNVYNKIYSMDTLNYKEEVDFINKIFEENKSEHILDVNIEEKTIESFLRIIKLKLMYTSNIDHKRIKLRTLLKEFKYKRRSDKFVRVVNKALRKIGLETYLKNYKECNISDIKLEDVIIIRLNKVCKQIL